MYVCMYVCMNVCMYACIYVHTSVTLGPWGVPSDVIRKRRARVAGLHGLRACRMVTSIVCARARVAWLHGLPSPVSLALGLPRAAGSASFNAVEFLVIYFFRGFSIFEQSRMFFEQRLLYCTNIT